MRSRTAPITELALGSLLGGYRIVALAGRGGMGIVYRATQLGLDRTVALKLIAPEFAHDRQFRERFKRESRLAASIDHPNVIPVYEAGEAAGALFIAMRWVEGANLLTMIKRGGGLEPEKAARITAQVGAGLDAAHDHGLVHRDVKPANVLVVAGRAEHAYLTDFGLVKRTKASTEVTHSGEFVGTLDYIAPEQLEGKPDACSDVYSLGCVLFQSLTGRVPFDKDTEIAKITAHLHECPPSPSEVTPGVPRPFDEVVGRAMAKDRKGRYGSAGQLGRAAVAAVNGADGEPTRKVTRGAPTLALPRGALRGRRIRRRSLGALVAILSICGAGALLALGVVFDRGSSGQATSHSRSETRAGTLLKARGEPGIYVVKAGAKFLLSHRERSVFFAGERKKIRLVSSATLQRIPDIPRDGSRVEPYGSSLAWLVRKGQRTPVRSPQSSGAVVIPIKGLAQIPLRAGGHRTTLTVTKAPELAKEARKFRLVAQARSPAGTPRGRCLFFRITRPGLIERANVEAQNGRCVAVLTVQNLPSVRYSVHFYGYKGWRSPTASTRRIHVEQRQ
jgi:hypothetical protein